MLEAKGRIELPIPCEAWIEQALATPGLSLVPLSVEVALASTRLPEGLHSDPIDRILVATARYMRATLMTRDQKLIEYGRRRHVSMMQG